MERYAFSSEWQVLLDSQDGLRVYHNRNDSDILSSFAARVLITLILELTWGILLFGLRGPPSALSSARSTLPRRSS